MDPTRDDQEQAPTAIVSPEGSSADATITDRVTLVVTTDAGELGRTGVSGPGGAVRVAVGEHGHRSSTWRIWAGAGKNDVYVAAREIAASQKFSLHESGDWRYQWTTRNRAIAYTGESRRTIDRWQRPSERAGGWTHALSIWIPHGALSTIPSDRPPKRGSIDFVPEPPEGFAIGIHVILARTDQGYVPTGGTIPIDGFWLPSGEVVLVLVGRRPVTEGDLAWLRSYHRRALSAAPSTVSYDGSARIGLFGQDDGAVRWVWDMAAATEP